MKTLVVLINREKLIREIWKGKKDIAHRSSKITMQLEQFAFYDQYDSFLGRDANLR